MNQKILCPVDFSECSAQALRFAVTLASRLGATIDVVHTYHVPHYIQPSLLIWAGSGPRPLLDLAKEQATRELNDFLDETLDARRQDVTARLIYGEAAASIIALTKEEGFSLVVLGSHGRSGWRRLVLGSVSEQVVRRSPCPVLTVPAPQGGPASSDASAPPSSSTSGHSSPV